MNDKEQYNCRTRLKEIVPSTRFGQALASLFYLKRHKKRDDYGRAPVVSRLRAPSTLHIESSPSCDTLPFEVLTPKQTPTMSQPPV